MQNVNVLFVGLGARGYGYLELLLSMEEVNVLAVCDLYEDRLKNAVKLVEDKKGNTPLASTNYKELIDNKDLDCVFVVSDWTSHVEICLAGLENGLYVATEVGGATSINQCWELVRTSERTGKPCMMLENCCYNREEMTVLNMVKKGLFGELVHCEGGYRHDLRDEVALGNVNRHYRLKNYKHRNGDVYPTHEIGPIAKYLDINRGNRFISLTSTASKSVGIPQWIKDNKGEDFENANFKFALGDVVTTVIKCAHGETITLYHDTSLPRPYSRANLVQGTKGLWSEDKHAVYIEGLSPKGDNWWGHEWDDIENYYEKFEHPLWKEYRSEGVRAGHGGMDYLVQRAFITSVMNQTNTPIDVYDTATWMAITPLSEDSISCGSMPMPIPDFTNGKWLDREPILEGKFCLNKICEDSYDGTL